MTFREIEREKKANGLKVLIPLNFYLCLLILQEEINGLSLSIYI